MKAINLNDNKINKTFVKPVESTFRFYSPNFNNILDIYPKGLNLQAQKDKIFIEKKERGYSSINWSHDSNKLIYITGNYYEAEYIDLKTMSKKTFNLKKNI